MFAANTQDLQICESAFRVIWPPSVFSHTLHETTDRNIKLRKTDSIQIIPKQLYINHPVTRIYGLIYSI